MNAKVTCRSCGMETGTDDYRDQIQEWLETVCENTFDDAGVRGQEPETG